jgi:hypothetical protein
MRKCPNSNKLSVNVPRPINGAINSHLRENITESKVTTQYKYSPQNLKVGKITVILSDPNISRSFSVNAITMSKSISTYQSLTPRSTSPACSRPTDRCPSSCQSHTASLYAPRAEHRSIPVISSASSLYPPQSKRLVILPQHIRHNKEPHMRPSDVHLVQMRHASIAGRHSDILELHIHVVLSLEQLPAVDLSGRNFECDNVTLQQKHISMIRLTASSPRLVLSCPQLLEIPEGEVGLKKLDGVPELRSAA